MKHFTLIMTSYIVWGFVTWWLSLESPLREYQSRVYLCIALYKTVRHPAQIEWRTIFRSEVYREWMCATVFVYVFMRYLRDLSDITCWHLIRSRDVDNENACDASGCSSGRISLNVPCIVKGAKKRQKWWYSLLECAISQRRCIC